MNIHTVITKRLLRTVTVVLITVLVLSITIWNTPQAYATGEPQPSDTVQPEPSEPASEPDIITEADGTQYAEGEVIVGFKKSASDSAITSTLEEVDSTIQQNINGAVVAQVPDGETVESFIDTLEDQQAVAFAQPNYFYNFDKTVNDPLAGSQWYLDKIGIPGAWDLTMGSPDVKVAILDTGIDLTLPEFSGQIFAQADTVTNDGNAQDDSNAYSCYGHGTHVAGIIAGKADNGIGIAGVAPGVSLIPVDVFDGAGAWSTDIVEGIYFAIDNGADVINMSFGGSGADSYLESVINAAVNAGVICVAAAGNDNSDSYLHPSDFESVISVIATNSDDTRAYFSNYGELKDISAPGMSILSTVPGGGYEYWNGTSMASPVVAGVAALLRSVNPHLTVAQVKDVLYSTAVDLGDTGKDIYYANGRVNAYAAVLKASDPGANRCTVSVSANNPSYGQVSGGGTYTAGATAALHASPSTGYRFIRWSEGGSEVSVNRDYSFIVTKDTALTAEFAPLNPVAVSFSKVDVSVYNGSDGAITAAASGGDSGTYQYAMGSGGWQASGSFTGLAAGTYTIFARDAEHPENTAACTVTINQPISNKIIPANKLPYRANAGTAVTIVPPAAPRGYTTQSVRFSSSNTAVAAVDQSGNLTFLAGGKATIITKTKYQATDSKGRVKTKTITIRRTVRVRQLLSSVSLNLIDASIMRTLRVKLIPSFAPVTASNKTLKWTSSNPRVASVSSAGVVRAKAVGTAVITCTATDGSGVSAHSTITVTPISPTGIKLSRKALWLKAGKTAWLTAYVSPRNTDYKAVTWASSNTAVATVDARGKVRAVSRGKAVITAATVNGHTVSCVVTVR